MIKRIARRNFMLVTLSSLVLQVPAMGGGGGGVEGWYGVVYVPIKFTNLPDLSIGFCNILMIPLIGS